jgi:hypothetical protein
MIPFSRSKKAMLFNIMLVIFTIIVLTTAFIKLSSRKCITPEVCVEKEIGEYPIDVMLKIQEGSKAMIYLDVAARFSLYQSLYELQKNGGLSDTGDCGMYYDFAVWKDAKGKYCLPEKKDVRESFQKYVTASLLGRLYKYPHADFISGFVVAPVVSLETPEAAQQAIVEGSALTYGAESHRCTGTYPDFTKQITYKSVEHPDWFPEGGVSIMIPKEGNCAGKLPLIMYFHGCHSGLPPKPTDPAGVINTMKTLVSEKKSDPVILVIPTQSRGDGWQDSADGACGPALWGSSFDIKKVIDEVTAGLPQGITVSSVSFAGHNGAGCNLQGGLHEAAQLYPNAYAFGIFDTCAAGKYGEDFKKKIRSDTKMIFTYGTMKDKFTEQDEVLGITQTVECPKVEIVAAGGELSNCRFDQGKNRFGFELLTASHTIPVPVGMEQMLKMFFAPSKSQPPTPGQPPGAAPNPVASDKNPPVQL